MNCLALETEEGILVVDCGVTFPEDDHGVDLLHPDLTYLFERAERVCGVFLTHGHEDHMAALPFLLAKLHVPVWGPQHALKLALRRVRERDPMGEQLKVDFRPAVPGEVYAVGPFRVEPVRVAHSIIEATALYIETPAGSVLHTGDFKFDLAPPDGQPTDEQRLAELGARGVDLLLSDSTNVDTHGAAGSERSVADALEDVISRARQRVVVGLFSSNVQRLISLGHIARRTGRKIGLLGRSLRTHVETAHDLGHLAWNSEHRLNSDQLATCRPGDLLVLAGGTQAEAGSAMSRIAQADHPALCLSSGDSVILSSRVIPGNERRVSRMVSDLLRLDVDLHTYSTSRDLHTSGHATRPELTHMIELVRPRCFIPVHGTRHHLQHHAELARQCGVPECLVIENGQVAALRGGQLYREGHVASGHVAIDRGSSTLSREVLRERFAIGRSGVLQLFLVLDQDGALCCPARLSTWGVARLDEPEVGAQLAREAEQLLQKQSKIWLKRGRDAALELEKFLSWRLERIVGTRPHVSVQISRV